MLYKLLSVHHGSVNNIGDYVQALASSQFLPHIDGFINRENLKDYSGEKCCVILNGWFMHEPSQWPPSEKIMPFFLSFHLNTSVKEKMLSEKGVEYLKKYSPIGCRDYNTVRLLREKGIDAYFSGCMTLTLGKSFKSIEKDDVCYFVDPINGIPKDFFSIMKDLFALVFNYGKIRKIIQRLQKKNKCWLDYVRYAHFYRLFVKIFSVKTLLEAKYISQESSYYTENFKTDELLLTEAERLVKLYARAKFVVTSRIHCALPCLGVETPVVYVSNNKDNEVSACRMDGLLGLFNVVENDGNRLVPKFNLCGGKIEDCLWRNSDNWKFLASKLNDLCLSFFKRSENE